MEPKADIALIGLAVMGQNLILNMNDHGFTVVAFNRTVEKVDHFMANEAKGTKVIGAHSIEEMVAQLKRPRRVMLMVKAGKPVDEFIEHLLPHLEPGDIIIDGGNSLFEDTARRVKYVESKGLLYIGTGVSGGEEGARHGPSIMPGGSPAAWPHVKDIFQAIAAKVDNGTPCCDWVGEGGAGHYVKMVHNGIEYGDMQLICEAYNILKNGLGMTADEMHLVLKEWDHTIEQWILRLNSLSKWCPEFELPPIGDEDRRHLIEQICHGAIGYKDIKDREVRGVVQSWLSHPQRELLDKHAPERLSLANGRTPKVSYEASNPPHIAMRIQELYDVMQTPKIALGRVPVLVHILTPGMKPVQVTQDLANFWREHYPRIKSELQRRYPKHEWR